MPKRKSILVTGLVAIATLLSIYGWKYYLGRVGPSNPDPTAMAYLEANKGRVERGLEYCNISGEALVLDFYYPTKPVTAPAPLVVYIHGGGWFFGTRLTGDAEKPILDLRNHGYYVASIGYRLLPDHPFPAQAIDAKCAVRFLRANRDKYHIDEQKISAAGFSAGGHLALMLALSDKPEFEQGDNLDQSSKVQSAISIAGPTDLTAAEIRKIYQPVMDKAGVKVPEETIKLASPINYAKENSVPILLIHGDADKVVPVSQSQTLYDKLRQSGGQSVLEVVNGGGHQIPPNTEAKNWTQFLLEFLNNL